MSISYKDAGVDIQAGAAAVAAIKDVVRRTYTPEVMGDLGGFGGLFNAAALKQMDDPILVSGTDGVGTKLELARRLGKYDTVGIDLVAMCANDIVTCGAKPLFFLDYIAIGKLEPELIAEVVGGIATGCQQSGCALVGGEMAEHPGLMADGDFDLSGFCVGVVDRAQMIGPERVQAGDAVLGLPSSGIHSNGFSLVRKAVTDKLTDDELAIVKLDNGESLAAALLAPTRLYIKPLISALQAGLPIHAAAHITGGGITNNLDRALPVGLNAQIQLESWPVLPVIQYVSTAAALTQEELLATFNAGIGMVLITPANSVDTIRQHFDEPVFEIGTIVKADSAIKPGVVKYVR